jgi:hypothetical protein
VKEETEMEYPLVIHPHNPKHYSVMTATTGPGLSGLTAIKKLVTAYIRSLIGVTDNTCMIRGALCDMLRIDRDLLQNDVKQELETLSGWLSADNSGPLAETMRHWLHHAWYGCLALHELGAEDGEYSELPFIINFLDRTQFWLNAVYATRGLPEQNLAAVDTVVPVWAVLDDLFRYAREWDDALGHQ